MQDVPPAAIRFVGSGHFTLKAHAREIGAAMGDFLAKHMGCPPPEPHALLGLGLHLRFKAAEPGPPLKETDHDRHPN